jgi:hypothetical protein
MDQRPGARMKDQAKPTNNCQIWPVVKYDPFHMAVNDRPVNVILIDYSYKSE